MYAAVVPVQNEAGRIGIVLRNLLNLSLDIIIPVVNGCSDTSMEEVLSLNDHRIKPIFFVESLGIDIPRAVGACYALHQGCQGILFVDGDMTGLSPLHLNHLLEALDQGIDLALVNCYPYITNRQRLAKTVLHFRGYLNRQLGLFRDLGLASPAHGPHALSRRLLEKIDPYFLAIPPMVLVQAKQNNLIIKVVTSVPHSLLNSPIRQRGHTRKVAHTIIGDCLEALTYATGKKPSRTYGKYTFDGYHSSRRFDLLAQWQESLRQDRPTDSLVAWAQEKKDPV